MAAFCLIREAAGFSSAAARSRPSLCIWTYPHRKNGSSGILAQKNGGFRAGTWGNRAGGGDAGTTRSAHWERKVRPGSRHGVYFTTFFSRHAAAKSPLVRLYAGAGVVPFHGFPSDDLASRRGQEDPHYLTVD